MYKRSFFGWTKHTDFILIDTLCLQISYFLAYLIRYHSLGVYVVNNGVTTYSTTGIILFFLSIVVSIFFSTMHNVLSRGIWEEITHTFMQCALVTAIIVLLLYTDKSAERFSRTVLWITMGLYFVTSFITRLAYKQILLSHRRAVKKHGILLVGDRKGIEKAVEAFRAHPEDGIDVRGVVVVGDTASSDEQITGEKITDKQGAAEQTADNQTDTDKTISGYPIVATEADAALYIQKQWIDEVYIAVDDYTLLPTKLMEQCSEMAVTVHQQMFKVENVTGQQWFHRIAKQPVLTTSISIPKPRSIIIKRALDIIAGLFLSLAAGLVLLIVTPIIKKKSPGPVLLKHERVGQNGKRFFMYTIRTIYMPSTSGREIDGKTDEKTGIIPGVGQFLRRTRFEDLPKGFNVLLGSMSLVGTRAPSVEEWEQYEFRHRARLSCKPGITGLWQASGRAKTMSFEEATELDTEYIKNWNMGLDLQILFKTARL